MLDHSELLQTVLRAVGEHERDKRETISLIATENVLSPLAKAALSTDFAQRYLLLDNTVWEYPQNSKLFEVASITEEVIRHLFGANYVNARPISGLNCMTVVLAALGKVGDTVYVMDPCAGGHGATGFVAGRLGMAVKYLKFDCSRLDFDLDGIAADFEATPPDLVYIDLSTILFPPSLRELVALCPGSRVYYDCSHVLGLMLDTTFFSPLKEGCAVAGGSTHKTFPGPQRGVILMQEEALAKAVERYSDSFISNHHLGSLLALCITAIEMLEFGAALSIQMRSNARALGSELMDQGLPVETRNGITSGVHQVWLRPDLFGVDSHEATAQLLSAGIVANCARIPHAPRCGKGLRFGTSEVTRLGLREAEMGELARLIADVLVRRRPAAEVAYEVKALRGSFLTPRFTLAADETMVKMSRFA